MLGLDVLVNVANIVYLFSYSVRDILWLRVLTVFGIALLMPYYYFQSTPLWPPIGWNTVFFAINIYWITRLLLDRRPVQFSDDERRLYQHALRNMNERDAFKLLRMGEWSTVPASTALLTQGETVGQLSLIVDGEVSVEMDGSLVDTLGEARFLGSISVLNKDRFSKAPVSVRTTKPTRVVVWQLSMLESLFEKDKDIQIALEASLGLEISRFLQTARMQLLYLWISGDHDRFRLERADDTP